MNSQLAFTIPPQPRTWEPPPVSAFAHGCVVAFDQTLNNTGWALLRHDFNGLRLMNCGMLRPPEDHLQSFEATYTRTRRLRDKVELLLGHLRETVGYDIDRVPMRVVHERPAISGHRIESALMAGYAIYEVTSGTARMVSNQHAKKTLLGRAGTKQNPVTKAHVKDAVERYIPSPAISRRLMWNEHIRDACMLGLTHFHDTAQETQA